MILFATVSILSMIGVWAIWERYPQAVDYIKLGRNQTTAPMEHKLDTSVR